MWGQVMGNGLGKLLSLFRKEKGKGRNCANSLGKERRNPIEEIFRVETVRLPTCIWE